MGQADESMLQVCRLTELKQIKQGKVQGGGGGGGGGGGQQAGMGGRGGSRQRGVGMGVG